MTQPSPTTPPMTRIPKARISTPGPRAIYRPESTMPRCRNALVQLLTTPRRSRGCAVTLVTAAILVLGLLGCTRDSYPQLIQVLDLAPHEAEVGDRLEVLGSGFPQGKAAHLVFRGNLHRPGFKPVNGVEIEVEGTVT